MAKDSVKMKWLVVGLAAATVMAFALVGRQMWIAAGESEHGSEVANKQLNGTAAAHKSSNQDANLDTVIAAAGEYGQKGEWGNAEAILREAARQHADVQRVRLAHAECLLQTRKLSEAFAEFDAALALGEIESSTRVTMGTLANMLGKLDRAEEHYAAVMLKDAGNADAPLFLGQVLLKQGKLDEAKANLLIAGRLSPQRSVVWGTMAEISLRENKLDMAEQHLKKARELEPRIAEWKVMEARVFNRRGQPERALETLAGLDDPRTLAVVTRLRAESLGMLGKKAEAAAVLAGASDAAAGDGELALEAALAAERAGDVEAARRFAARAERAGNAAGTEMVRRLK